MTIAIILTVYLVSIYGFALFLYDEWVSDKSPSEAPDWLIHLIVAIFSVCWPVTIAVLSIIRVFKR
ncbi:hypothetical protein D3C85_1183760 [compost metagenome]